MTRGRRLVFLSGAPRVSTRPDTEATGARAHVVGVISAFRALGWEVNSFIVGDRVPTAWVRPGSRQRMSRSYLRRVAADIVRIVMARHNARRSFAELAGHAEWVYERFGAFQSLGRAFQRQGTPWILETNSPLFREATDDRKSMVLSSLAWRAELAAYRRCDVLVCVSEELKDLILASGEIDAAKVVVSPNGVDTERFDPSTVRPLRHGDQFVLGWTGNMYSWAGLDLLLKAVASVRVKGVDVSVVLVGDGIERQRLHELAQHLGIARYVRFVDRVPWEEVPAHLMGFDLCYSGQVVVSSSGVMYHSPLKLYEYMAMARPVAASAFTDARELVEPGVTGFLFEPGDQAAVERVLERAYERRDCLASMGAVARDRVVARHSWRSRVEGLVESVQRILAERTG